MLGDLLVWKLWADIAHLDMLTCMLAQEANSCRRVRRTWCCPSATLGLVEEVKSARSSANPQQLDVSYVVVIPTLE